MKLLMACLLMIMPVTQAAELTDAEAEVCASEGGCLLVTREAFQRAVTEARDSACRGRT